VFVYACRIGAPHTVVFPLDHSQGPEKRAEIGIKDSLVRFSCGVEDVEDIWDDLEQALDKI
jgi:cystathionine beta-lyase/cystathionine gamma-synthase